MDKMFNKDEEIGCLLAFSPLYKKRKFCLTLFLTGNINKGMYILKKESSTYLAETKAK